MFNLLKCELSKNSCIILLFCIEHSVLPLQKSYSTRNGSEITFLKSIGEHIDELSELLIQVVEDGASIGFLPPLKLSEATKYWENVLNPEVILFVAKIKNQIVGSVQLHFMH